MPSKKQVSALFKGEIKIGSNLTENVMPIQSCAHSEKPGCYLIIVAQPHLCALTIPLRAAHDTGT